MTEQAKEIKIVVYNRNGKVLQTYLMEITDEKTMIDEIYLPKSATHIKLRYRVTEYNEDYEIDSVDLEHTDEDTDSSDSSR